MTRDTKARWRGRVQRWRRSGLTAREFAEREGINPSTLRWWASALRRDEEAGARFIEVTVPPAKAEGRIELVVRDDLVIRVCGAFDESVLRRVLAVVEGR